MIEIAGGLARPKGNVTGLTVASDEQHAKCVELLKQLHPAARRIGVLVNPLSKAYRDYPTPLVGALAPLGLEFVRAEAGRGQASLIEAFATLATASVDAVIVTADPTFNQPPMDRYISELARARRLAVAGMFEGLVRAGGTLCLATDYQALIRRSAVYVDKILKGAKPGDLPIERPSVFQVIVNLQAARRLGIEVPPAILLRADEVIE